MKKTLVNVDFPEEKFTKFKLYSIDEVASALAVGRLTIYRLLKQKILKKVQVGRSVRITEKSLAEFIEDGGNREINQD